MNSLKAVFFCTIILCFNFKLSSQTTKENKLPIHQHEVFFENNSSIVSDSEISKLNNCLDSMGKFEATGIILEGHTNSLGSTTSNQKLSDNRVVSVKELLLKKNNDKYVISTKSLGELKPRYSNDNENGLAKNRQVVVSFDKSVKQKKVNGEVLAGGKGKKNVTVYFKNKMVNDSTKTDDSGKFSFYATEKVAINIFTAEKNYFNQSQTFTPAINADNKVILELTPYDVNKEISLSNILFYSNKNVVRDGVEDVLASLTKNFQVNEEYCFEIQGHVHGTDMQADRTKYYKDLSEARAGTVYFYMKNKGIKADRMIPVGYSNTKMLYPNDNLTTEQLIQNMRVVIKILPCQEVQQKRRQFNEDNWMQLTKSPYFNKI